MGIMESFENTGTGGNVIMGSKTRYARELYLFGNGDGKPVRDRNRLIALSGISGITFERHNRAWQAEAEEIARGAGGMADDGSRIMGRRVAAEMQHLHIASVKTLAAELERLRNLLPYLTAGSDAHLSTLKAFQAALKQFSEESGIADKFKTIATLERETLKRSLLPPGDRATEPTTAPGVHDFVIE